MSSMTRTSSVAPSLTWRSSAPKSSSLPPPVRHSRSSSPPNCPARSNSGPSGRGVNRLSHAPQDQRAAGRSRWNCSRTAVLPTPASPHSKTSPPCPSPASRARRVMSASASCRSSSSMQLVCVMRPRASCCGAGDRAGADGRLARGGEPVRGAAGLAERGGHHVGCLPGGRERLDDLGHGVVRVLAVFVRELTVFVLDNEKPGELLAQLRQVPPDELEAGDKGTEVG